jgi:hypothetical protein
MPRRDWKARLEIASCGFRYFCMTLTRVAETLCETVGLPPVPVMVNGYVPRPTLACTVTVSVVLVPLAGFGLKLPVAPEGRPVTVKFTGAVKPPVGVIVTV